MSEMVERVARAMKEAMVGGPAFTNASGGLLNVTLDGVFDLHDVARAAIEAMREPTAAMDDAMEDAMASESGAHVWQTGIDVALGGIDKDFPAGKALFNREYKLPSRERVWSSMSAAGKAAWQADAERQDRPCS